mmetsp:Transcript_29900/g.88882  ORF Transcript_29900/g.88882 Transcript_29900/m.88882 type:complete len:101 (+) Transcript_29900:325-627(+)
MCTNIVGISVKKELRHDMCASRCHSHPNTTATLAEDNAELFSVLSQLFKLDRVHIAREKSDPGQKDVNVSPNAEMSMSRPTQSTNTSQPTDADVEENRMM